MPDQDQYKELIDGYRVITYPFHLGDLIGGTTNLTNAQFGAYMRILLALIQKPMGFSMVKVKSYSRMSGRHWPEFWELVGDKFVEENGIIYHKRVRKTVYEMACKSAKNSDNSLKRWESDNANAKPKKSKRNTSLLTSNPKESLRGYDVILFLKDDELLKLRGEFQGWEISEFIRMFNEAVRKKGERPLYPLKALQSYIEKATEGKTP